MIFLLTRLAAAEELGIEAFWVGPDILREEFWEFFSEEKAPLQVSEELAAQSRFLTKGDQIREVGDLFAEQGIECGEGWLYLNESSGYLVAKAPAQTLGMLEFRYRFAPDSHIPVNLKQTWEVFSVACEGEEVVDWARGWEEREKECLFAMSSFSRSGETFTQKLEGEEGPKCAVECSPVIDGERQVWDIRLVLSWEGEEFNYDLQTGLSLREGEDFFLEMGTFAEGRTHVLRLRPEVVLVGGPPWRERHLLESGEKVATPLIQHGRQWEELPPLNGKRVRLLRLFPDELGSLYDEPAPAGDDPFAVDDEREEERTKMRNLPAAPEVPQMLTQLWPRESWIDVAEILKDCGVDLTEEDFAYHGAIDNILVVCAQDESNFDLLEQIFSYLCGGRAPYLVASHWRMIREQEGRREVLSRASLACRSGESGKFSMKAGKEFLEVEAMATVGATGQIDLRLAVQTRGAVVGELNTGLTFREGESHEFLLRKVDGVSFFLTVQVEEVAPFAPEKD